MVITAATMLKDKVPNKESNDFSHDVFSANEPSRGEKMAQYVVSYVHMAPEEVFKYDHVINRKISTQQSQN